MSHPFFIHGKKKQKNPQRVSVTLYFEENDSPMDRRLLSATTVNTLRKSSKEKKKRVKYLVSKSLIISVLLH